MDKKQDNTFYENMQGFSKDELIELLLAAMQMANKFDHNRLANVATRTENVGDGAEMEQQPINNGQNIAPSGVVLGVGADEESSKYIDDYLNQQEQTMKYFSRQGLF